MALVADALDHSEAREERCWTPDNASPPEIVLASARFRWRDRAMATVGHFVVTQTRNTEGVGGDPAPSASPFEISKPTTVACFLKRCI